MEVDLVDDRVESSAATAIEKWRPHALLALRVVAGLLLFQAGAMKIFGWYGGLPHGMKFVLASQVGVGAVLEVICGPAIMLGLLTRPMAFLMAGQMAVAYWQFHFPQANWPIQNGGQPAALLCFIFLFLAIEGGGSFALDELIRKRRSKG